MRYLAVALLAVSVFGQTPVPSSGWVVIPVSEYASLRAKAFPAPTQIDSPPIEATLTRVDYDLHIMGGFASGRADLTIDVLKDGWVRIPIPAGLLAREARLDGKLVSLVPDAASRSGSQVSAVISARGRVVLTLDVALPVATASGEEKLSLPASASGVTRASVTLARQEIDVKVIR